MLLHAHDLLDQKFLESGKFTPAYINGSVHQAVLEIVKIVSLGVINKEIKIKCDISRLKSFPVLSFDKRRLQQVLYNLMTNAIKFTRKGLITISSSLKTRQNIDGALILAVSVADQGIGIAAYEVDHVFDGFLETTNSESKALNPYGNGIGLQFCKQVC